MEGTNVIRNRMLWTCVAMGASVAATGQSREENWDRCTSVNAEISIAGCTALINSGQELPATLSIIHYNLGASFQEKKQYDAALKNFDEAIRLNPNFAQALNGRGAAYLEAGNYAKAIQDFSTAVQLNSFYSIAYFNRGRAYSKQGDYDRAIEDYNHDLKLVPTHADGFAERGDAYRMKHQDDLA